MMARERLATTRKRVLRSRRQRRHEAYTVSREAALLNPEMTALLESADVREPADSTETPLWRGVEVQPGSENTAERQRAQREHGRSRARLPRNRAGERRLDRLNNHLAHSARLPPKRANNAVWAGTVSRDKRGWRCAAREVLASS